MSDDFHFPRPVLEFTLIKAELDQAIMRAMDRHPELVAPESRLAMVAAISRQLLVSPLNPECREARE